MLFVRCGSDTGRCYELAGQNCPGGYDLFPSIGREAGDVLVRCRVARPYGTSAWGWAPAPDPVDPWAPRGAAPAPPSTAPPPPLSGPGGAVPSSSADPRFRRFDDPDLGY